MWHSNVEDMLSITTFWTFDQVEEYKLWSRGSNWGKQGQEGSHYEVQWDYLYGLCKVHVASFEIICFTQKCGMLARCSIQITTWPSTSKCHFDLCGFQWKLHNESPKWDSKHALAQHTCKYLGYDYLQVQSIIWSYFI